MTQIITTAVKEKIQKDLSYPLGAKLISEQLVGIPQFEEIKLCFYGRNGNRFGSYVPDENLTKLKGAGAHSSKLYAFREIMIVRWWDDFWSIAIFGLKSEVCNVAKHCLINFALPEMNSWLCKHRENMWFEGKRRLYIGFTENIGEIAIIELHNNELVEVKYILVPDTI